MPIIGLILLFSLINISNVYIFIVLSIIAIICFYLLGSFIGKKYVQAIQVYFDEEKINFDYIDKNNEIIKEHIAFSLNEIRSFSYDTIFEYKRFSLIFHDNTTFSLDYFTALEKDDDFYLLKKDFNDMIKHLNNKQLSNNKKNNTNKTFIPILSFWDSVMAGMILAFCIIALLIVLFLIFYAQYDLSLGNSSIAIFTIAYIIIFIRNKIKIKKTTTTN